MEKERQQLWCDSDVVDSIAVHLQLDKAEKVGAAEQLALQAGSRVWSGVRVGQGIR